MSVNNIEIETPTVKAYCTVYRAHELEQLPILRIIQTRYKYTYPSGYVHRTRVFKYIKMGFGLGGSQRVKLCVCESSKNDEKGDGVAV